MCVKIYIKRFPPDPQRGQLRCYRSRKTVLPPREFLEESKSSHKDRKEECDGERREVKEGGRLRSTLHYTLRNKGTKAVTVAVPFQKVHVCT